MPEAAGRNLAGKSFLNVVSAVAGYGISLIVNFFLNPLLVRALGADLFGVWRVCQRLLVYMAATDGRPTQALKWTIASQQLQDDISAKQRQIGSALLVWLRFLPLVLVFGGLLSWFAPALIRHLPASLYGVTRLAVAVLLLNLLVSLLRAIPEAVLIGMNLAYRTTWINALGVVLGGVFMALAAWLHWGLIGLAGGLLLASLVNGGLILALARRCLPWIAAHRPSRQEVREFFRFSLWIFAWSFIGKLMYSCDVIILAMVTEPAKVAAYTLSFYAVQTAIHLIGLFISAAMPGLGAIVGQQDFVRASRARREILALTLAVAAFFGALILLWNRSFVGLWVGDRHFVGAATNLLLVILMTQQVLIRNDAQVIDVTLKVKSKALLGGVSAVLSIVLAFVFGLYVWPGIVGVLVGLIVGRLLLTLTYPRIVRQYLGERGPRPDFGTLRNGLYIVALFSLCQLASGYLAVHSWWTLLLGGLASVPLVGLLTFTLGLSRWQRTQVRLRVDQLWRKSPFAARGGGDDTPGADA